MGRFTGNSFKITPILIQGKSKDEENIDFISNIINNRLFSLDILPNAGWVSFQLANNRDFIDTKQPIQSLDLPDKTRVLPATTLVDRLDNRLKNKLSPKFYSELPEKDRYITIPTDYIFYNDNNKLFCLFSSTYQRSVDISIKDFLVNHPFAEYGFTINKNPTEFTIPSDMILWVLYRNYEKKGEIDSNILISDVSLLDGRLKIPVSLQYAGKSTPEHLTELKYSIAQNRIFTKVELTLKINGDIFQFNLDTTGCVEFKPSMSEYCKESEDINANLSKATHIYKAIIPTLKNTYQSDTQWFSHTRNDFIRKCADDCKKEL